jgi:deglycase
MANKKIAVLLGQGFEDSEFRVPYDRLGEAGFEPEIIGTRAGEELRGYRGKETVKADRGIDEVSPDDYAALLIPGGYSPDHLRADERFVELVKTFNATGRPLAAVCHGPQLFIAAGLVRGRTLTAWKTIQEDLRQIGANVKDEPVVIDGNLISSRQPSDLEPFSQSLIDRLRAEEEEEEEPARRRAEGAAESEGLRASEEEEAVAEEHQAREGQPPRGKL